MVMLQSKDGKLINPATSDAPSTFVDGQKVITADDTGEVLGSDTTIKGVWCEPDEDNSNNVYVGDSSNQRKKLDVGYWIPVDNLNKVYVKGKTDDKVNYQYVV